MRFLRLSIGAGALLALCACGGGNGLGGIFNTQNTCQTGTLVQVVSPTPGQFASNVNAITIVASGSNDNIHPNPQSWSLNAVTNGGAIGISGGPLNPFDGRNLPHPFTSDFYYQSQLSQTLPPGYTWTVTLQQNNVSCTAVQLPQTFST